MAQMSNLNIVEALGQIAREKNVDRELVIQTLTDALVSAAKKRYGDTDNFEVDFDSDTGRMAVLARKTVVEEVTEPELEIELEEARLIDEQAQLGSVVFEELNLADFGRNAIQTAKQILIQRVREAEREKIFDEFTGRVGQIESGTVQQISHGDIVLNLGRAEAAIPLKEQIRRERYRQGDSIRGYIFEVLKSTRGPQVLLSRSHPEFLRKLFAIEVPEIAEGIVTVHSVSREPGERAKIAVSSNDDRVDPVGACVGVKGSRVQAIVRELSGERIDIVPWSDEPEVFISRALSPATVSRVVIDIRRRHASVIVAEDQLSLSIGRSGQNSRLAVQLTGWGLDIITDDQYQARRARIEESQEELRRLPNVSELISLSLATSGFLSIRSVAESDVEMLETVPGLEADEAAAVLKAAAEQYVVEAEARGEELRPTVIEDEPRMEAAQEDSAPDSSLPDLEEGAVDAEDAEVEGGDDQEPAAVEAEPEEGEVSQSSEEDDASDGADGADGTDGTGDTEDAPAATVASTSSEAGVSEDGVQTEAVADGGERANADVG